MLFGADIQELRKLSAMMSKSSGRLSSLNSSITASVASTRWPGPDGERFRSHWNSALRKNLVDAQNFLEQQAKILLRNADEQERASMSTGSAAQGIGRTSPGNDDWNFSDFLDAYTDPDYQTAPSALEELLLGLLGSSSDWRRDAKIEELLESAIKTGVPVASALLKFVPILDIALSLADFAVAVEHQDAFAMDTAAREVALSVLSSIGDVAVVPGLIIDGAGLVLNLIEAGTGQPLSKTGYDILQSLLPGTGDFMSDVQDFVREFVDPLVDPTVNTIIDATENAIDEVNEDPLRYVGPLQPFSL